MGAVISFLFRNELVPLWLLQAIAELAVYFIRAEMWWRKRTWTATEHHDNEADFVAKVRAEPIVVDGEATGESTWYYQSVDEAKLWLPKPLKFSVDHWNKGVTSRTQAQLDSTDLIIERAGITDGMKVLDIGAGYGMIGQHIARRFPRCEIVSLTAQREAADYLKDQCAAEGITNVQSIAADVVDVRSTSGSCPGSGDTVLDDDFDVVLAIEFIEHARNAEAMLAHLSQFARPRTGVLLLQTWVSPQVPMDMTGHFMEQFLGRAMCLQPHTMRLFQTEWKMEREWALPPTDGRTTFRRHAIALTRNKKRLTYERAKFFCEHTDGLEMGDALQKAGKQMTMIQIAHCMTSAFYGQGFLVTQHIKMRRR